MAKRRRIAPGQPIIDRMVDYISERFDLIALYLYGSFASGRVTRNSDIDWGVLYRTVPDPLEVLDAQVELEDLVGRRVDLVKMNDASPILLFQIYRNGMLLKTWDQRATWDYFFRSLTDYYDLKITRRPIEEAILRKAREGR